MLEASQLLTTRKQIRIRIVTDRRDPKKNQNSSEPVKLRIRTVGWGAGWDLRLETLSCHPENGVFTDMKALFWPFVHEGLFGYGS